jgi:hypothetical protein
MAGSGGFAENTGITRVLARSRLWEFGLSARNVQKKKCLR